MFNYLECKEPLKAFLDCFFQDYVQFCSTLLLATTIGVLFWSAFNYRFISRSRRTVSKIEQYYALTKAILENDVVTTIRILEKYPELINRRHRLDGYTPFMRVCLMGKTQLVLFMLQRGADVHSRTAKLETPFYLAVFHHIQNPSIRDASCIRALYYARSDINAPNDKGLSPLHLATMFGHSTLVRWLLNKGAKANVRPDLYTIARLQGSC